MISLRTCFMHFYIVICKLKEMISNQMDIATEIARNAQIILYKFIYSLYTGQNQDMGSTTACLSVSKPDIHGYVSSKHACSIDGPNTDHKRFP